MFKTKKHTTTSDGFLQAHQSMFNGLEWDNKALEELSDQLVVEIELKKGQSEHVKTFINENETIGEIKRLQKIIHPPQGRS